VIWVILVWAMQYNEQCKNKFPRSEASEG
jgi:hypothetical protein